jgi:hypothetical protein
VKVKRALADKCEHLAQLRKSKPAKAKLYRKADSYRRQAERLSLR